jgi:DNA-binding NtrC family response regulator
MRTVLIIEPEVAHAQALQERLREAGLTNKCTVLKNGAAAKRRLAARDRSSIMLLNVHAADGDGMRLLDWLREQSFYKELLVIAVGERTQLRAVVEACERGAHTFVIKPVHVEDLKTLARTYPTHWGRAPE